MDPIIFSKLIELEKTNNVRVLYACESGSRAWGFPSPDSDYDVRFIYLHDIDWYLSLRDRKNTIDLPVSGDLDLGGWELKKALQLLRKSNPPLLEWLFSPIVYTSNAAFLTDLKELAKMFFSPVAVMHHYLSMSKKYHELCLEGENIRLKRYFYALRTAIAGKWVKETLTVPTTEMQNMYSILDQKLTEKINELINIKSSQKEDYLHPREPMIDSFLSQTIRENEEAAPGLPASKGDIGLLDDFYRKTVKGAFA